jgi:hypothetical protein
MTDEILMLHASAPLFSMLHDRPEPTWGASTMPFDRFQPEPRKAVRGGAPMTTGIQNPTPGTREHFLRVTQLRR